MTRLEKACPYPAGSREFRCERCSVAHGGVPPCVAAYLGGQVAAEQVVPLEAIEERRARKAA